MAYEWNPLWSDVVDDINPVYLDRVRRMVMASINWLDEHPDAKPEWRELSKEQLARSAGVPEGTDLSTIAIVGAWEDFYEPKNSYARHWFRAISDACGKGDASPSVLMMGKAIACGMLFKKNGWDEFNTFMLEHVDPSATRQ